MKTQLIPMITKQWLAVILVLMMLPLVAIAGAEEILDKQLFEAAKAGNAQEVINLLEKGADPNAKDDLGVSALNAAAFNGNLTVVRELIRRGADINSRDEAGFTPLMAACYNGHKDIVRVLLERGADPNIKNQSGRTARIIAYQRGYSEITDLLGYEETRATVVLASIKLVIIAIILGWIARKNRNRPLGKSFFDDQKWTLGDAYKILIPSLALTYAHLVLVDPVRMPHPTQLLMIDLLLCIALYGLYWRFIKKRHGVTWSTFGLDNTSLNKSGLILFNVASISVLFGHGIPRAFGWSDSNAQVPVSLGLDAIHLSTSILILPILEELLFRGVLYAPVARRVGSPAAIGLLTVVNSLAHLHYTWETLVVAVGFFLLYCVYVRSLSLFGPIIWHITWNLVSHLDYRPSSYALEPYLLLGLLVLLIIVDSVWLLGRLKDNTRSNTETRFRA